MKKEILLICLIAIASCVSWYGCTQNDRREVIPPSKSTLIYVIADNNLDYYAMKNIKELEQGLPVDGKGHVFVFVDRDKNGDPSHPYLMRTSPDTISQSMNSIILRSYKEQNSCDPECLKQIINDVEEYCKPLNTKLSRLVLWSHGTGWLPRGTPFDSNKYTPELHSFGLDEGETSQGEKGEEMEITELSEALAGHHFELLVMDACFMGTVETAYELKDYFDYMVLSPSEILAGGFPYADIAHNLIDDGMDACNIADKYFSFYDNKKKGFRSATVTVVDSKYLKELARTMQAFYGELSKMNRSEKEAMREQIFQYDRTESGYFFDFLQFVGKASADEAIQKKILEIWSKVIVSYRHTDMMFSVLNLAGTSGLSIYIPNSYEGREKTHAYYKKLAWSKDSGVHLLMD